MALIISLIFCLCMRTKLIKIALINTVRGKTRLSVNFFINYGERARYLLCVPYLSGVVRVHELVMVAFNGHVLGQQMVIQKSPSLIHANLVLLFVRVLCPQLLHRNGLGICFHRVMVDRLGRIEVTQLDVVVAVSILLFFESRCVLPIRGYMRGSILL